MLSISLNVAFIAVWMMHSFFFCQTVPGQTDGTSMESASMPPLYRDLGLAPEQWKRIEPQAKTFREQTTLQRKAIQTLQERMLTLMAATPVDMSAIKAKQKEILAERNQMHGLVIDHLLTVKGILTPEQQKTMFTIIRRQCLESCPPGDVYSTKRGSPQSMKE
jgi:Spy/CpxP family protein refolding chaperone